MASMHVCWWYRDTDSKHYASASALMVYLGEVKTVDGFIILLILD